MMDGGLLAHRPVPVQEPVSFMELFLLPCRLTLNRSIYMNLKRFSPLFALLLVLTSACAAPAPGAPAATPTTTPVENDAPIPFPGNTAVLVWHREGGIAGFCDDLTVYADGSFKVANCMANPENERPGQLNAEQLMQLSGWVRTFKSFSVSEGEDATYPDAMILKATFKGVGTTQVSPDDLAAIHNFASLLVAQQQ
jgi:hypothetical protein